MFCFQRAPLPQSSIGAENVLKWCASNTSKKLRSLTPEDLAHKKIDHQLESCGWVVDNISNMAVMSVSLREYHSTNESPEVKKGTANTSPKRERVNQHIVSGRALTAGSSHWGYRRLAPCRSHVAHPDLASTLGARISRLARNRSEAWHKNVEDDGIPFTEKMATLTSELADQFAESAKLEKAIRKNMKSLGFELPVGGKK